MQLTCQVAVGGIAGEGNQAGSTMNGYKKRETQKKKARECRLQARDFMEELTREAAELKKATYSRQT